MRHAEKVLLGAALLLAPCARAQVQTNDPNYFKLDPKSVVVQEEPNPPGTPFAAAPSDLPSPPPLGNAGIDIGIIVNLGEKVWDLIQANKPVVDIATVSASALPKGVQDWRQLEGWNPPEAKTYGFTAKNVYGLQVINVKYQIAYSYGGSADGTGYYLANVKVVPLLTEVAWGYKFSMSVEMSDPLNAGSSVDPIAGLQATLHWTIKTVAKESRGTGLYYVQGNGLFKEVGSPM